MSLPADEQKLLTEFTLTRWTIIQWTVLGTGATLVAAVVFTVVYGIGTGQESVEFGFQIGSFDSAVAAFVLFLLSIVVPVVGVIVVHEAIHAAVIRYYGGDVSYGVGVAGFILLYAYVTTTRRLTRNQFVVVALAPLVVITLVGIPLVLLLDAVVLIIPLAVNAGGSIGDLWIVGILQRYPKHAVVEDTKTGLRVYGRPDDDPVPQATTRDFLRRLAYGSVFGFGFLVAGAVAVPILLVLGGWSAFTLGVPDTAWTVFSFEIGPDEFAAGINVAGMAVVSLLLGVGYALATISRPPSPEPE